MQAACHGRGRRGTPHVFNGFAHVGRRDPGGRCRFGRAGGPGGHTRDRRLFQSLVANPLVEGIDGRGVGADVPTIDLQEHARRQGRLKPPPPRPAIRLAEVEFQRQ